jgi:hypothetical protein
MNNEQLTVNGELDSTRHFRVPIILQVLLSYLDSY